MLTPGRSMCAILAIAMTSVAGYGACLQDSQEESRNPSLSVRMCPINSGVSTREEVWVKAVFTNCSKGNVRVSLPYEWGGIVYDWFEVLHDGHMLPSKLSETQYGFRKKTSLEPKESVTVVFKLSTLVNLPENKSERIGRYEISVVAGVTVDGYCLLREAKDGAVVEVSEAGVEVTIPAEVDLNEHEELQKLLASGKLSSAQARKILVSACKDMRSGDFWNAVGSCSDAYAVVGALQDGRTLDVSAVEILLKHGDLAVRRAVIAKLKELGKNAEIARQLETFLSKTKDEPCLELGKESIKTLRGE